MKACVLRPRARQDRRDEIRYYRREAGATVAVQLVASLQRALNELSRHPTIGSPIIGQELGLNGLRSWRIKGFPLTLWYFDRDDCIDVVRLVGERQDALGVET